ncbi:MAG: hypothetical protein M1514_01325 [Patescibacteria group bacterium]|nr:hypothetical protein [Patescibacteria group bacterium]
MKKLFRLQDYLFLALAGIGDFYDEIKDPFGNIANGYEALYGYIPKRYRRKQYYQTVYHSLKTGDIEKVIKNNVPCLRLTSSGKEKIQRQFSFLRFQKQKWDGKWRLVIFDIKERYRKDRDLLRIKLKELGFGMIQESVWLSPYDFLIDFREYIKSIGLDESVYALEVNDLLAGNPKSLAERVWNLEKINDKYTNLYQELTKIHGRVKLSTSKEEEKENERGRLREQYLEILKEDPCLPKELLPDDWLGDKVKMLLG